MIKLASPFIAQRTGVLVLTPYYAHSTVKGLLQNIDKEKSKVFTYLFNETPSEEDEGYSFEGTEFISQLREPYASFDIPIQRQRMHVRDIAQVVRENDIDLIIPTKEKYVSMLARSKTVLGDKVFLPSADVVDLLLDKADSYDFFEKYGIKSPDFSKFSRKDISGLDSLLNKLGHVFVKPSSESGGKRAHKVSSLEEFAEYYDHESGELLACEMLNLPEYNHTIIAKGGEIKVHATYLCPGSANFAQYPRKVVQNEEVTEIAEQAYGALKSFYGVEATEGVYNIDFLTDDNGNYVLNEVNVGRLPGGHSIFQEQGLNLSDELINYAVERRSLSMAS